MDEQQSTEIKPIQTWAVVELMGHVKTAGMVSEESHFGTVLLRVDVPAVDRQIARTEFYGGGAIYRLIPCEEQVARMVLSQTRQEPIVYFKLPKPSFEQVDMFEDDTMQ